MGKLELEGLTKKFGKQEVIKSIDLTVEHGEFVVILGPSGCGKSTILRLIAGLEELSHGSISIDGVVVNTLSPIQRGIAMVFQSYALYPHMSVFENIAFPLRVANLSQSEIEQRVGAVAQILSLEPNLTHKPSTLSGGQRQRVAIGRAIVREPKVFLFDEPLSNLDATLRANMRVELCRLHNKLENTMLYVTHDQAEAMTMASKIVVIRDGRVEQEGPPSELFHNPKNKFVAGFLGNPPMNFLSVSGRCVSDRGVEVAISDHCCNTLPVCGQVEPGEELTLGIRPDDLRVGQGPSQLELIPDVIEKLGNQSVLYGQTPLGEPMCAVISNDNYVTLGEKVPMRFDSGRAHLFRRSGAAFLKR